MDVEELTLTIRPVHVPHPHRFCAYLRSFLTAHKAARWLTLFRPYRQNRQEAELLLCDRLDVSR